MTFSFRPAKREKVNLLIGLASGTGGGKTFSALRLATGICGDKPFCLIDTEAGRAKHYADQFKFDHGDLAPPFTPERYTEAIIAADKAGYPCIVVDSASHVWAGDGGVLDMQEAELDRMAGNDYKKRERVKMASWIKPKMAHKKMVQKLLQVRAHLILCFRAEEKMEMKRNEKGKLEVVKKEGATGLQGWFPICEKNLPFELTASFLMLADKPGIPIPIKLQEQHRALFPAGKHIDESAGKAIAEWASAGNGASEPASQAQRQPSDNEYISMPQQKKLCDAANDAGWTRDHFRGYLKEVHGLESTGEILDSSFSKIIAVIEQGPESYKPDLDEDGKPLPF